MPCEAVLGTPWMVAFREAFRDGYRENSKSSTLEVPSGHTGLFDLTLFTSGDTEAQDGIKEPQAESGT